MNLKRIVTKNGSPVIPNNKLVVWNVDGKLFVINVILLL